ncbi:hypothetical protein Taro_032604 [Colocasia esculenta]|uniref:Aminotransferase-like plant mobile domain-containing protein n=1 Tax=Colocasia esculenta TaxID=4460 RepID=A0A843VZJ8_COLES|nr:hypothetical protein [Colocasia esculenta]
MDLQGEMRARVSWTLVLVVFLAFHPFQREWVEEMGFSEIFRMERMRVDPALTQALRSRWDTEATAFVFPWGHMIPNLEDVSRITGLRVYGRPVSGYTYPCYHELAEQLLDLPVERRSSLVPRVALQESLGLYEAGKNAGESEDEYLERLSRVSRRELASEPGPQADLDLRRFLVLFLGRLLFATRGDAVHCRLLPLLEDLAHQFDGLSTSERQTSTSGFYPFLQVWAYLHLLALGRGDLTRPGLVPIARRWDSRRDTRHLADQLERLQEAIGRYPYLDRSLGLRQSVVEFSVRDYFRRPGRSFRGLHDTTDWRERAREQIENWERKGKARSELEKVRGARASGASSSRTGESTPSLLETRLAGAVLRAEEAQRHLEERLTTEHALELQGERDRFRGEAQATRSERDQLRIRAEAAEARVAEMTRELATLRVQRLPGDQEEVTRLRAELFAQQTVARSLQQIVMDIGRSHSRSRSGASVSRATGASIGQLSCAGDCFDPTLEALKVLSGHTLIEAPVSTNAASMATLFIVSVTHKGIFLASGVANSPSEKVIVGPLFTIESTEGRLSGFMSSLTMTLCRKALRAS